jgi:hypothetical protein
MQPAVRVASENRNPAAFCLLTTTRRGDVILRFAWVPSGEHLSHKWRRTMQLAAAIARIKVAMTERDALSSMLYLRAIPLVRASAMLGAQCSNIMPQWRALCSERNALN